MMRRTKRDTFMGQPIISLPKKRIRMVELGELPLSRSLPQHVPQQR